MKISCFVFCIVLIMSNIHGQVYDYNFSDFQSPISKGKIPDDFIKRINEKYKASITEFDQVTDKKEKKDKQVFSLFMNNAIHDILLSGKVTFNDEISTYINKVADRIKKSNPGKFDNIRIYTLKTPSFNASATGLGIVFINVGLMAYLKNEAQLAYILCHEFSHIVEKDNLNSYLEKKKIAKGKGAYGDLSFDEKVDELFMHDKEIEFTADYNSIVYLMNSGYDPNEIISALDVMHYSYLPIVNIPFDKTFFNRDGFNIPTVYFREKVDSISSVENYKDTYHTHPNIYSRKEAVRKVISAITNKPTAKFYLPEKEFQEVNTIARFEMIKLLLLYKSYTEAIYYAYTLLQEFPNNKYLEISIGKALYGLSKFRNSDESHLVTISYNKVEGESQQLHYLFRQLSKVQLNVLALKFNQELIYKYPEEWMLKEMRKELVFELIYDNELEIEKFYDEIKQEVLPKELQKNNLSSQEIIQAQKVVSKFYLNAFTKEKKDETFLSLFKDALVEVNKKREFYRLSYEDREKKREDKFKETRKNGISLKGKNAIMLDPLYVILDKDYIEDPIKSEIEKKEMDQEIKEHIKSRGLKLQFVSSKDLTENSVDDYNKLCFYKEMREELLMKMECIVLPLSNDFKSFSDKNNISTMIITGRLRQNRTLNYYFFVYNVSNGKNQYGQFYTVDGNLSAKTKLFKDLSILKP